MPCMSLGGVPATPACRTPPLACLWCTSHGVLQQVITMPHLPITGLQFQMYTMRLMDGSIYLCWWVAGTVAGRRCQVGRSRAGAAGGPPWEAPSGGPWGASPRPLAAARPPTAAGRPLEASSQAPAAAPSCAAHGRSRAAAARPASAAPPLLARPCTWARRRPRAAAPAAAAAGSLAAAAAGGTPAEGAAGNPAVTAGSLAAAAAGTPAAAPAASTAAAAAAAATARSARSPAAGPCRGVCPSAGEASAARLAPASAYRRQEAHSHQKNVLAPGWAQSYDELSSRHAWEWRSPHRGRGGGAIAQTHACQLVTGRLTGHPCALLGLRWNGVHARRPCKPPVRFSQGCLRIVQGLLQRLRLLWWQARAPRRHAQRLGSWRALALRSGYATCTFRPKCQQHRNQKYLSPQHTLFHTAIRSA